MYKNLFDTHTHSEHSFDGHHSVLSLCESAIDRGAVGIAVTDHCDIDGMLDECWSFQDKQQEDCVECKKKFNNRLKVLSGVELGQGIYVSGLAEKFLGKYDFDFVLGSIHNLEGMEDFYFLDYSEVDIDELLGRYFNDILRLARWNRVDSIAHLTYPFRYIASDGRFSANASDYYDIIDEIFAEIIRNDKALELNVSGLTMDLRDTMPPEALIRRYKEMGGRYITVGSDSHYCDRICNDIDKGYDLLLRCGFTHFTIFEKREPILIPIE